ncbi:MAG: hypothetical protein Crog4KO_04640 [Crocinitomicaceae bacterium]
MKQILFFLLLLTSAWSAAQNWSNLTDFSGLSRDDGCSFVIDDVAYCGTGRDVQFNMTHDFYAFDFNTEQWTEIASIPFGVRRQYAIAETYNSEGYVFGGFNDQGEFMKDLWRYNPIQNSWYYLGQAPFEGRSGMQSFVIDDELFIVGGRTESSVAVNEVWAYNFSTGTWSAKNNMPNEGIWRGFDAVYNGEGIVGMGSDSTNTKRGEVYFYNPTTDLWTEMPLLETDPMNYPAASQIDDRVYVYGGEDTTSTLRNDFRYLDLTGMTWNTLNSFPQSARRGCMAFTSTTDFFITTGLTATERLDETWVARNVVGLGEAIKNEALQFYVNDGILMVSEELEEFKLVNNMGQSIPLEFIQPGQFGLPGGIPAGLYIGYGHTDKQLASGKIIIGN